MQQHTTFVLKGLLINIDLELCAKHCKRYRECMNERVTKNYSHGISVPVSGSGWSEGATETAKSSRHFSLADSGSGLNIHSFP